MTKFPQFTDVASMNSLQTINEEIFLFEKFLFELNITLGAKKGTLDKENRISDMLFGSFKKPHYFIFVKRRLAHLKYHRSILLKRQSQN